MFCLGKPLVCKEHSLYVMNIIIHPYLIFFTCLFDMLLKLETLLYRLTFMKVTWVVRQQDHIVIAAYMFCQSVYQTINVELA